MRTNFVQRSLAPALLVLVCGAALGCPGKDGEATDTNVTTDATVGTTTGTDGSSAPSTTIDPTTTDATATTTEGGQLTTTEDTLGTTTMEIDSRCECVETWSFGSDSYSCAKGSCGVLNGRCEHQGGGDTDTGGDTGDGECVFTGVTEEKLNCALDRLIAGEVGFGAEWSYTSDSGFSSSGGWVTIVGDDRTAVMRRWWWLDLGGEETSAGLVRLKDAAYFEGCKAEPDLEARFDCLVGWTDDEPDALCDEEGSGSDI
ncbi:hypothetical protein [Nannocystis radixulma]|uniref:C-type lectin domain-containing protein n=1 Tax=Nannocystis radixulma TaxID=2995305 RepID=A0ABT5B4X9_9BACT|nr:hypothetical protein [Nannocystis radixulma]MDC0669163.1 hypothetical protein [Nannocystis radixulma]